MVTGGSGFVGRSVVPEFRRLGVDVVVADRVPYPGAGVTMVQGDLTDPAVRDRAVTPDLAGIVHLAALTSVLRSAEQPQETFATNVDMTQGLLELARRRGVAPFILASTNAVVGNVGTSTITENSPLRPLTPYGATKAACEMLLSGYAGAYGMVTCALRFTNIYGPGMAAKDSFVPRLMRAALAGGGVQVYGDGTQARDLVHVEDVATAVVDAWQRRYSGTVIVGAARSVTVLDLVEAARTATGAPLPVEHVSAKTGEMPAVIVDVSRARTELGYRPRYELADGLRTVWDDFRAADDSSAPRPDVAPAGPAPAR
ncbi:MAG TPA: NAD(P)-dependent oxidoreductase [Pseudonocardiaceae bacterium]|nr:NAD(P)-dependent oxidoreductase [Pseudonocardiaceae bacterium]